MTLHAVHRVGIVIARHTVLHRRGSHHCSQPEEPDKELDSVLTELDTEYKDADKRIFTQ